MTRACPRVRLCAGLFGVLGAGCGPLTDTVFEPGALELRAEPVRVREEAGVATIPVVLGAEPRSTVTASYRVTGIEAQDSCQTPDFQAAEGTLVWPAGATEAFIDLRIGDDDLAETDEQLRVVVDNVQGGATAGPVEIAVTIEDDDRTELIDARASYGLAPGRADDQSAALQAALDQAAATERGVVVMAPGEYVILGVTLAPGTTLSGRGATLERPAASASTTVTLNATRSNATDSEPTLVEGLTLDGHRDEQGAYSDAELEHAHLIRLSGSVEQPGRLRATLENVALRSSTASGVFLGPGTDTTLCQLRGEDLWRDFVTLRGGGSRLRARDLDATTTDGTTGMWIGNRDAGYDGVRDIDAEIEDVRLAGDLELESYDATKIVARNLTMTQPPFRLLAPSGTVRITDSVLQLGIASEAHNHFGIPHDVEITGTTLVLSERDDGGREPSEADRSLAAASVRWEITDQEYNTAAQPHRLVFDTCRFEAEDDIETRDVAVAVDSDGNLGSTVVRSSVLGPNLDDWFGTGCLECTLEP